MRILMLYGTTEGHTAKVCDFIAARLRSAGEDVVLVDASSTPTANINDYQAAIVAASIHVGQYQRPVVDFVRANHAWLSKVPSAFISVSLSAVSSDAEERRSLATITENFRAYTGWTNAQIHHVAGAFRFTEYDFFKRWVMRLVAWEKGVKVEPGRDFELTDWQALGATVDELRERFLRTL